MLSTLEPESAYRAFNLNLVSELAPLQLGEGHSPTQVLLSGGGARNATLTARLRQLAPELAWRTTNDAGVDADAKEAMGFAVLGYLTLAGQPGNSPATGVGVAPAVLGKVAPAGVGRPIPHFYFPAPGPS